MKSILKKRYFKFVSMVVLVTFCNITLGGNYYAYAFERGARSVE